MSKWVQTNSDDGIRLGEVFDAPELFEAYPDLRSKRVFFEDMGQDDYGLATEDGDIVINRKIFSDVQKNARMLSRIFVHEIQHVIQGIEGFATGGDYDTVSNFTRRQSIKDNSYFKGKNFTRQAQVIFDNLSEKKRQAFTQLWEATKSLPYKEFLKAVDENDTMSQRDKEKFLSWSRLLYAADNPLSMSMGRAEEYLRLGGEVEARNAAGRSELTAQERRGTFPKDTQDIEDEKQIILDSYRHAFSKDSRSAESYHQTLQRDAQAWSESVDGVLDGSISKDTHIKVMDTPGVFELIGAKHLPVYMDAGKILGAMAKHPAITPEIIKQIPVAMADPIAIFRSATHPNDSIVVMTEIIDRDGGTVVVPVQLDITQDSYQINRVASVFAKKNDETGEVHDDWFVRQINEGRLLYINKEKSSQWSTRTRLLLPVGSSNENLERSIPDEQDLARLNADRASGTSNIETYHQIIGPDGARRLDEAEGVTTRMDNLKVAKRMMKEKKPADSIWRATGWMKGKEDKWRYEIPDGRIINRLRYTKGVHDEYKRLSEKTTADDYREYERIVREKLNEGMSPVEINAYLSANNISYVEEYDYSKLTPEELKRLRELEDILDGVSLPDAFDAPELFDAYPELRTIRYIEQELEEDKLGKYQPEDNTIVINSALDDSEARDTIIHEMQHVIQEIEGFGRGSDFHWNDDPVHLRLLKRANRLLTSVEDAGLRDEWLNAIEAFDEDKVETLVKRAANDKQRRTFAKLKGVYEAIDKRYDKVYYRYKRRAGETEARNAARRADWDKERRKDTPLDASEDVPRSEQVIGRRPKKSQAFEIYSQSASSRQEQAFALIDNSHELAEQITALASGNVEKYSQRYNRYGDTDREIEALLARDRRAEPAFRRLMSKLQKELGGELITRQQMKSPERILVKADRLFGGDASKVGDVWAGTLVFDTEDELLNALGKLRERKELVHLDNRWFRPKKSSGYRDIISHLALKDGTVVELQLQLKDMQNVKDGVGHSVYEFTSNNRYDYELHDAVWAAGDISKRLYAAAVDGSYKGLSAESKETLRRLGQDLAAVEDAEEAVKAVRALQEFIDEYLPDKATARPTTRSTTSSLAIDPIADTYIRQTPDAVIVPMDSLKPTEKVTSTSVAKAKRNMQAALDGVMSKRKPLTVLRKANSDGTHSIIDGNNTYAVLKELGARNVPVTFVGNKGFISNEMIERYSQQDIPANNFILTPEAQMQMDELRSKYEGTEQWMKAPNGENTNLTERQWLAVRTPNFIRWFGDWENNPQDASKVLDANGEPMVVYRGVNGSRLQKDGTLPGTFKAAQAWEREPGAFLTSNRKAAATYTKTIHDYLIRPSSVTDDALTYEVFANIRTPYIFEGDGQHWERLEEHIVIADRKNNILHRNFKDWQEAREFFNEHYIGAELNEAARKINDYLGEHEDELQERTDKRVEELKQMAEAEGNDFDEEHESERIYEEESLRLLSPKERELLDKYHDIRRKYRVDSYYRTTDEIVREVVQGLRGTAPSGEKHDGVIFRNIYDVIDVNVPTGTQHKDLLGDVIVPLRQTNIKSATSNNGNFSIDNLDIYHQPRFNPSSDQEAIDYFNKYKAEHLDGFITPDAVEHFDQWVTHATGNIILNNRFDLRYVGSSEGGSAFGHGAYFEQSREVAETYRHYGLSEEDITRHGLLGVSLKDGRTFSWADNREWSIENNDVYRALYALKQRLDNFPHATNEETIAAVREDIEYLIQKHKRRAADKTFVQQLQREIEVLDAISDIQRITPKRGNIYNFEIPEDYELLDWDESLEHQSKETTPIIMRIVDTINNNPAELIAFGFAQDTKNPKIAQARLQRIINSLMKKYKGHYLNSYEFRELPEYRRLKSILRNEDTVDNLRSAINSNGNSRKMDTLSATGEALYWKLTDLTGSKVNASMYLNQQGIPGHRFLDNWSRDDYTGEHTTHNFVIWNMDKVRMIGIDSTSDQEAIDYFNTHRDRQLELFDGNSEHYSQLIADNIKRGNDAMDKVISEHTDVIDAMFRDDLGGISFLWVPQDVAQGSKAVRVYLTS